MKDRNLFQECNDQKLVSDFEFIQMFCRRCRNPDCVLAEGGENSWVKRMSTQEDRLLINPRFATPDDPRFAAIRAQHFQEMLERAYQMEIADRRQDWMIPEIGDGTQTSTTTVDQAVRQLAFAQGKVPPELPSGGTLPVTEPPVIQHNPPLLQRLPINTQVPAQGVMIDGTEPMPPSALPPPVITDTWEVPAEKKIPMGGKVVLSYVGGKKE